MGRGDQISGFFWLIFSLFIIEESYRLGLGKLHSPGTGFLPIAAATTLAILSLLLLLSTISRRRIKVEKEEYLAFDKKRLPKVFYVLMPLFIYPIFLDTLGFILCTMIFLGFLLRAIEPQKWLTVIALAISIPLISFLIFDIWLKAQLPRGVLGF